MSATNFRLLSGPSGGVSFIVGVSSDGSKILASDSGSGAMIIFSRNGASTTIPQGTLSGASGLTADGSKIVGGLNGAPAIYTIGGGVEIYPVPAGYVNGAAGDVYNGDILLANAFGEAGSVSPYIVSDGATRFLPDLGIFTQTQAIALSEAGFVVVGRSANKPVRWTNVTSPTASALTDNQGSAIDLSRDGSVIVGQMSSGSTAVAFRWTQSSGAVALPLPTGTKGGGAVAVSGDGKVVLGSAALNSNTTGEVRPFVWTKATGSRLIEDFVEFEGEPYGGLTRVSVSDLSDDGKTVVGTGTIMIEGRGLTRGFVLSLP